MSDEPPCPHCGGLVINNGKKAWCSACQEFEVDLEVVAEIRRFMESQGGSATEEEIDRHMEQWAKKRGLI